MMEGMRLLVLLGRALEFALTGEADFRVTTLGGRPAERVTSTAQGRPLLKGVLDELDQEFGLRLREPVVLEVEKPKPLGWGTKRDVGRYRLEQYGQNRFHHVQLTPDLPRVRFRAVLAHELTHAWQRENGTPEKHAMREGMARWVEYHVLHRGGMRQEAGQLLRVRYYLFGRAVGSILEYERRHGRRETLRWLTGRP